MGRAEDHAVTVRRDQVLAVSVGGEVILAFGPLADIGAAGRQPDPALLDVEDDRDLGSVQKHHTVEQGHLHRPPRTCPRQATRSEPPMPYTRWPGRPLRCSGWPRTPVHA